MIVTGAGPQSKVITPPAATALTTAAEVQLAAVPVPMTLSGLLVSTALASAGTEAFPPGLPGLGRAATLAGDDDDGTADGAGEEGRALGAAGAGASDGATKAGAGAAGGGGDDPHPASSSAQLNTEILECTGRY
ncbi:hypothetical protein AFR_19650 [Actinoplanes friuliensis DSM 7358]|uniref:Uncharacterized protein n=1 Tax=Actinoplanes friuliensis DSM 7358 TaxID=1246995 RepID=U5VZK3_9ACTN|nr:hypothetical protein AFR_19650 [Actinoplanes friuliensis DSM 7358]